MQDEALACAMQGLLSCLMPWSPLHCPAGKERVSGGPTYRIKAETLTPGLFQATSALCSKEWLNWFPNIPGNLKQQ